MKLSDYVIDFLGKKTDTVFFLSGGGIMHLVDSLGKSKNINAVCCHHEQTVATAAEGYARINNTIGVAMVTTGPGGTNAITGAAGAWLDSIPLLIINGQVKTAIITPRRYGKLMVRATGFQELNVIDLVKPISKYAETVRKAEDIRYHLEKAAYLANSGRPGPSWVEIPLDIQEVDINPLTLRGFSPPPPPNYIIPMQHIVTMLNKAKRPLLLVGNGIRLACGEEILWKLINKLKINVITSLYTADDLVTYEYPNYLGRQGMWGNYTANWAVDNCDLLLVIGDRLSLTQTSHDYKNFATQAYKIMADFDKGELNKKILSIDLPIFTDPKILLSKLYTQKIQLNRWDVEIKNMDLNEYRSSKKYVNIYKFLDKINIYLKTQNIVRSNAMSASSTHQIIRIKKGQRLIGNDGLGQMGQGLPLAIGVCFAAGKRPTICFEGDGSIMLNIQELQTILHHKLPIIIFILNNGGYYSIRNTHLKYFKKEFASSPETGVSLPNYAKIIPAWGYKYMRINKDNELFKLKKIMKEKGPLVCEVMIDPFQKMQQVWSAGMFRQNNV